MSLIQIGLLALVVLVLGLFVVRPVLAKSPGLLPPALTSLPATKLESGNVLTGEIEDTPASSGDVLPTSGSMNAGELTALRGRTEDPVERLRSMIGERQEETVEILRGWLEEKEENV